MDQLAGRVNYFRGHDPAGWRQNIPVFAKVRSNEVYPPGIDVVYYGTSQGQLDYDFIVAPGANPDLIVLALEGAERARVLLQGDLLLDVAGGQVRLRKPVIYQVNDGQRVEVAGGYEIIFQEPACQRSGLQPDCAPIMSKFRIADYDPALTLVIDPILDYSTYLGGSGHDAPRGLVVDAAGNV